MSKDRQIILRFGMLGFVIAALIFMYSALYDYTKQPSLLDMVLGLASVILCPPYVLAAFCLDCEIGSGGGTFVWFVVGLLNTALYLAIGAAYVRLRKKLDKPATG